MMLHKHLQYEDAERDPSRLHASSVTKREQEYCPRATALKVMHNEREWPTRVNTSLAVTFKWGRLVEDQVREWFQEMGYAIGDWKCRHKPCGAMYYWGGRPDVCANCGGTAFHYIERRARSAESGISCGIDLLVHVGRPKPVLLECKSIDKDEFKALARPAIEHQRRTQLYLRCMAEDPDPVWQQVDLESAYVIYVSKGGFGVTCPEMVAWPFQDGKFSPFKPYVVHRDDEATQPFYEKGKAAFEALTGGKLPCRICSSITSPRALECKVRGRCFERND